jgi:hypothetical protein
VRPGRWPPSPRGGGDSGRRSRSGEDRAVAAPSRPRVAWGDDARAAVLVCLRDPLLI